MASAPVRTTCEARANGLHPQGVLAVEHIRRMRGGSQPQLMRCADGFYYVVKFQNNPQGVRTLANELLGTLLAKSLGLPVPDPAVINVKQILIDLTWDMVIELENGRVPCRAGTCFGSRYLGLQKAHDVEGLPSGCDFLADESLRHVENLRDFLGMLVFDKWTYNADTRQVVFARPNVRVPCRTLMIDHGFCFNGAEWNFPDLPRRGLFLKKCVYEAVRGIQSFEPWLERLETKISIDVIDRITTQIPAEWYEGDASGLSRLASQLDARRTMVGDLLWSTWRHNRQAFPNWNCKIAAAGLSVQ
ncbi:MAG: phosphatidylinositol kinase [Acidobacteria bacterium]|nr:phosphatidylinositol kinase [Acidobacteriota bacterium]